MTVNFAEIAILETFSCVQKINYIKWIINGGNTWKHLTVDEQMSSDSFKIEIWKIFAYRSSLSLSIYIYIYICKGIGIK